MNIIHEKLERLDQAILNSATTAELRGYIVDIRDYLAARQERDLTTENEILRSELSEATKQNESLKAQLQDAKRASERAAKPQGKTHDDRPEKEHNILLLLMSRDGLTYQEIARHLGFGEQLARHHVTQLEKADFLYPTLYIGSPAEWHLSDDARTYLIERDLLQ
jgi:DNA-binding NarL/FixJ family response regulator